MSNREIFKDIASQLFGGIIAIPAGYKLSYVQPPIEQEELDRYERGLGTPSWAIDANLRKKIKKDRKILRNAQISFLYVNPDAFNAQRVYIYVYLDKNEG